MWLGPGRVLTGIFRYYNSSNDSFPEVGQFLAWIHVAKFVPLGPTHIRQTNEEAGDEVETERQLNEWQTAEDTANNEGSTSLETVEQPDAVHMVGDIIQLIPIKTDDMRQRAYINVSGAAVNANKTDGFFEVNAAQYTSHYKNNRTLSILPVQAHFSSNKYKTKKPIPSNNTYVTIEGFLEDIETDMAGRVTLFHVSVDNINFLGRATLSASTASSKAPSTPSRSSRFKFNFDAVSPSSSTEASAPSSPSMTATPQPEDGILTRAGKRRK